MRLLKWAGIVVGALLVLLLIAVGGLLVYVSSDHFKSALAGRAGSTTGRDVEIAGDIDIDWGRKRASCSNGLRIGNADWGSDPVMGSAERVEFTIRLTSLLRGPLVLPELIVTRPKLLLERNKDGATNWDFSQNPDAAAAAEAVSPDDRTEFPLIGRLAIRDGRLLYKDPARGVDVASKVDTATGTATGKEEVRLDGEGSFEGKPFHLELVAGSLLQLRDPSDPYPIRVDARIGKTKGTIEGTMSDPIQMEGLDIRLDFRPDMAELFPIFGIPLPKTPPYRLSGLLQRTGERWRLSDLKGAVWRQRSLGDLALDTGGQRPKVTADLVSQRLDFDDLATLVGAPPAAGPNETASPEQKKEAQQRRERADPPHAKVDLAWLRAMDMTVSLVGKDVIAPSLPMKISRRSSCSTTAGSPSSRCPSEWPADASRGGW